jgi:hypothetical protein
VIGVAVVLVALVRALERSNYPGARCETADVPSRLRVFLLRR